MKSSRKYEKWKKKKAFWKLQQQQKAFHLKLNKDENALEESIKRNLPSEEIKKRKFSLGKQS